MSILTLILIVFVVALLISCFRIVPQTEVQIVEFLGKYKTTWEAGLHLKIPFLERVARKVSLKEQVGDFPPQPVITKDNVMVQIDTVVFYSVFDAKQFTYGVHNPVNALINLTATTLRNIIGSLDLDDTLTSRDTINLQMQKVLDEATDKWGIKVARVELKNIMPPKDIQDSMEKQMRAEREKRQTILEAEAHKESSVKRAEGDKAATVLKAEAERDAAVAIAQGKAESIRLVYEAEAAGLEALNKVVLNESVLTIRKLEALKAVADGQATKLILPTELMSVAGSLSVAGNLLGVNNDIKPAEKKENTEPAKDECCSSDERSDVTKGLYVAATSV